MTMEENLLVIQANAGVGRITLNDPNRLNPLSQAMCAQLLGALEQMWYDPAIRVVVLRGAGGNFSAGGDLIGMKQRCDILRRGEAPDVDGRAMLRRLGRLTATIRSMDKPVIAHLEGAIAGGGMGLAMACDFSIAAVNCKLVFPFINIGLAPDMGASLLLTRRVGLAKATELFMLGERFSGLEAAGWGVITQALPTEEVSERVEALCAKLAQGPAKAYASTKAALNRMLGQGLEDAMSAEIDAFSHLVHTADHAEAVDAFLEKRTSSFNGK